MYIAIDNLSFQYDKVLSIKDKALDNIKLTFNSGEITGIIGHSGSGKSTLIQLVAGLLKPTNGNIKIGKLSWNNKFEAKELRKQVGIVFQYPEHQLFEETVEKEIFFGPKILGIQEKQIHKNLLEIVDELKLPYSEIAQRSPFDLSGGQKRKVAIASVLAYKPKVLILDEPTAGLDSAGKKDMMNMISRLHKKQYSTVLVVSHNMDEVANISDKIVVLNKGKVLLEGTTEKVFAYNNLLKKNNLDIPEITKLIIKMNKELCFKIPLNCFSVDELEKHLIENLKENKK